MELAFCGVVGCGTDGRNGGGTLQVVEVDCTFEATSIIWVTSTMVEQFTSHKSHVISSHVMLHSSYVTNIRKLVIGHWINIICKSS